MLYARSRVVPNRPKDTKTSHALQYPIPVPTLDMRSKPKPKKSVAERREETRVAKRREGTKKRRAKKQHAARKGDDK
jgi:hypothetical protein